MIDHDGFGGDIEIIIGINLQKVITGVEILSIDETVGLGMNAKNEEFRNQYVGKKVDHFQVVKNGKQNEDEVTFGYNITKEEEKVNFNDNIDNIHNKIRGLSSIPGAYAIINNKRMKIYKSEKTNIKSNKEPGTIVDINSDGIYVTTLDYVIKLIDIKLEGKKRCLVKDFINGIKKEEYIGEVFE